MASESPAASKMTDGKTPLNISRISLLPNQYGAHTRISDLLREDYYEQHLDTVVTVCGWAKTVRKQSTICFIALNDGSTVKNLQIVVTSDLKNWDTLDKAGVGCSFKFIGTLVKSPMRGQTVELSLSQSDLHSFICYGGVEAGIYPLAKKKHSHDFLRQIAHLRPRTYFFAAVMRVRSQLAMATHHFFQTRGFNYIHTPIITEADCEGAGEMFQVTTVLENAVEDLPVQKKKDENGRDLIAYDQDFFGKMTYLTVSGQLPVENFCCGMGNVYTFGPTFRAEKSHTTRHLAEFWMIEPELAFADLDDLMRCAEDYLKFCVQWALENCSSEIDWFEEHETKGLKERLTKLVSSSFVRLSYTDAIEELSAHEKNFTNQATWGSDLATEHERYLTEIVYNSPVIVYDYPAKIKAFYMRLNQDKRTVRAMDVLLPGVGEVIGGSQREERLDILEEAIKSKKLDPESYWWYLELRKFGTIPHSGFGLGFERLIMVVTGVENIRDVIPYPRYSNHAEF